MGAPTWPPSPPRSEAPPAKPGRSSILQRGRSGTFATASGLNEHSSHSLPGGESMTMKKLITLIAMIVLASSELARAAVPVTITREDQRDVMVTIYNGNLGLVKDVRETRLGAGTTSV